MDLNQFVKQTNVFLEDVDEFEEIIQYLYKTLLPLGIRFTYETLEGIETRNLTRVVLVAKDSSKHFNKPIVNQCNGAIIGFYRIKQDGLTSSWSCKLLSRPPNVFCPKYKTINMRYYDVYKAEDGTTITLYHLDDEWLLSTKNGYDVGDLEWRGAKYKDLFMEALEETSPGFDINSLDKNVSYTIGFCHPIHHPFRNIKKIWFIYAYNLAEGTVADNPGLPEQEKIESDDHNELIYKAMGAYKNFIKTGEINFGYILRYCGHAKYKSMPDVFIESSLMSNIRRVLYQQTFIKDEKLRRKVKKRFSHIEYVILRSYLDINKKKILPNILPQYKETFEQFDNIVNQAVESICKGDPKDDLEKSLLVYTKSKLHIYGEAELSKDVVKDVITNPETIEIYVKHLYDWAIAE